MSVDLEIYTDGSSKGNPGSGGWGFVVVQNGKEVKTVYGGVHEVTNNQMELLAVKQALDWVVSVYGQSPPYPSIVIYSDSEYVVNCCSKWMATWKRNGWKTADKRPVKNQDILEIIDVALNKVPVSFSWVKGHSRNQWNTVADQLACQGSAEVYRTQAAQQLRASKRSSDT